MKKIFIALWIFSLSILQAEDHPKPTIAYVEVSGDWLRDAMIKGGLTAIVTNNPDLYKILLEDPATSKKCSLVPERQDLGKALLQLYQNPI